MWMSQVMCQGGVMGPAVADAPGGRREGPATDHQVARTLLPKAPIALVADRAIPGSHTY
jgi:hypothetical protein